jgi:N-acetylglucosaminyl-diphospho-decaprenol L-rhamnosyltransferase
VSTAVVTIAHGRHEHLRLQQRSLAAGTRPEAWVVVAMDDPALAGWPAYDGLRPEVVTVAADPAGLPLSRARNAGADRALALGADVLVFLDVDCVAGPGLVPAYADAVRDQPGTVWSGPVTYLPPPGPSGYDLAVLRLDAPHPARPAPAPGERAANPDPDLFWSLSFALSAGAWSRAGGFHEGYAGYGGEDTDFARVLLAAGLELGWLGAARAGHQWHEVESPPRRHLDDILRNGALFAERWGSWPMGGWLAAFEREGLVRRTPDGGWARAGD